MSEQTIKTDLCIIGAGSGGLSVAAGASQMGADTVLIERHKMGGDCLNTGCVPSKALLASAHAVYAATQSEKLGVSFEPAKMDMQAVHDHIHGVIQGIEPHDSQERFEKLGVHVIREEAHFVSPDEVVAGDHRIHARRFIIATGSRPRIPPIPGIDTVPFFTNESIFENTTLPEHLIVIGGGPIGLEMAQAYHRLGARVTVLEHSEILPKEDPDLVQVVLKQFTEKEGLDVKVGLNPLKVSQTANGGLVVTVEDQGETVKIPGSHLLLATGRQPNLETLNLKQANIVYGPQGIAVDQRLRTSNRKVFAIGDVSSMYQFTHMAGYQAGIVIRNALFRLPAKVDYRAVPWVTYTDPELANVGLNERQAKTEGISYNVYQKNFAENDRSRAERTTQGFVKVLTSKKGVILGASIVGTHAGELLQPWILAIQQKMKIGKMATFIAPYPTRSEINKAVAGSYFTPSLFSKKTQRLVRFLSRFG
ncbi:dihydrolipoyl dehydrogenase family protein [Magnetococcales bacterium HHB-1]